MKKTLRVQVCLPDLGLTHDQIAALNTKFYNDVKSSLKELKLDRNVVVITDIGNGNGDDDDKKPYGNK